MNDLTIRSEKAQKNLLEWSRRVADCRSSGFAVTRWCADHGIKPKTYYSWQKKVFAAMLEQRVRQMRPEPGFAELPVPAASIDLVASIRDGSASLEIYSGANAEVAAALCKALRHAT